MKNIYFTLLSLLFAVSVSGQLINDGASIVVEDGATLFIEGSLQNNLTGSINVQGTGVVEVEGDVIIAPTSTVTMSNTAKLILSGSNSSTITSGGATFTNVEMDKTSNNVSLLDQLRISMELNFVGDNNKLLIGDNNLVFAPSATITSADANEYIVADGNANTGLVSKELSANEVFKFEIGDATNYTPLDADISGTGYSSATVDVNVVPMEQPDKPAEATDFISRYWNVDQTGITDFTADLTGTYIPGDLTGTAGDVKGAFYNGSDWSYGTGGANIVEATVSENGDFTGTNSFGKVGLTVFLQGAYTGSSTMSATLNSILPLTSPYDATVTVTSIPANVTDWIEIEVRDASTPSTILSTQSAFLRNDGVVLSLDGNVNPLLINAPSTGVIGINHRNHLSINTASALNIATVGFDSHDFSSSLAQAYDNPGITGNDAMIDVGGVYCMWGGNGNGNTLVNYGVFGSDRVFLLTSPNTPGSITRGLGGDQNPIPAITGVYSNNDLNMNGTVNYGVFGSDRVFLLTQALQGSQTNIRQQHSN